MKLTILSAAPEPSSGWGRYTRDLVSGLEALGVEIMLITSSDAPADPGLPLASYYRILPSITHPARLNSLRILSSAPLVRHLSADAEAVHIFAEPYALATSLVQPPIFITAHGTYVPFSARRRGVGTLFRHVYRHSRIICVSSYTQQQVKAALPNAATVVIPNGVDISRYQRDAPLPPKHGPTVLCVGQVKARKGFHILARAMKAIRAKIPDVQAVFIGDTSDTAYVDAIKAQLSEDGLTEAIQFLGRVSDEVLLGWYHQADVFALPALNVGGKFEGFGLVYLEAGAAGLPVIGTRDCGAEDAIRDGETGFLVPQNDVAITAEAVIRLLSDSDLRMRMGKAGCAFAQEHTWDKVAARVLSAYRGDVT